MNRRRWLGSHTHWPLGLALTQLGWLGSCAAGSGVDGLPHRTGEHIVDMASGRPLSAADVLGRMRAADVVLLGEVHDNLHHHRRRAELLASLGRPVQVVVEHLPRGAALRLPIGLQIDQLRQMLEQAGFDSRGWQWPAHEPLFAAIARAGHPLQGGNLVRETTRQIARAGSAAMPVDLKAIVDAAPLSVKSRHALEQDLQAGHCGQLAARHLPGMVAAQRSRDAAMTATLIAALDEGRATRLLGPVVLLAGNGHVRRDYGVPQLLTGQLPGLRLLAIEFSEPAHRDSVVSDAPFDIVWTTPAASRADPCAGFVLPGPSTSP